MAILTQILAVKPTRSKISKILAITKKEELNPIPGCSHAKQAEAPDSKGR